MLFYCIQFFYWWLVKSLQFVIIIIVPVFIHEFLVKLANSFEHGH